LATAWSCAAAIRTWACARLSGIVAKYQLIVLGPTTRGTRRTAGSVVSAQKQKILQGM
jgi:hypothetical protein